MEDSAKQEILEAIHAFAEQVDIRFDRLEGRVGGLENRVGVLDDRVGHIETNISGLIAGVSNLKTDMAFVKSQMVTKDYLDDKLANLRGELVTLTRKENVKLSTLVDGLVTEGSLSRKTADFILAMEPFAQG
jgi:archaellum component FlaC